MVKLTLPDPSNLKDLARRPAPGPSQPQEFGGGSSPPPNPSRRPRCPGFSCCPTWRMTARCAWTG